MLSEEEDVKIIGHEVWRVKIPGEDIEKISGNRILSSQDLDFYCLNEYLTREDLSKDYNFIKVSTMMVSMQ